MEQASRFYGRAACVITLSLLTVAVTILSGCEQWQPSQKGLTMKSDKDMEHATIATDEMVVPVVEEQAHLEKTVRETGRVRVNKSVGQHPALVEDVLIDETVHVERVPVGRFVDEATPIRYEGDTIIVPVLEEVPVVVKRLRLKEELRIRRERAHTPYREQVEVRREEVTVERLPPHPATGPRIDTETVPSNQEERR